ncbi:MAG: class I tRNA ligase family protein, partial [Fibrobacterales bacterium]|nr:class I tRNA ligase family protein [Fibrobacterales bacterium]
KAEDLRFSETGVREIVKTVLLPLWNAMLLFVTYAEADAAKGQLSWKPGDVRRSSNELDRWIVAKQQDLLAKIEAEMSAFRLYNVVPAIVQFIDELTNWYIRRSRRRFWKSENDGDKNDAYATLYEVLVTLSKTLAPFLPFLSEKMWQVLVRDAGRADGLVSVHQCGFPSADDAKRDPELVARMDMVRSIVEMGRSLRAQNNLKNRQPLSALTVAARDAAKRELVSRMRDIVCEELNVHELRIVEREDDLVRFSAKANFKALGSRLGKQMKSAAAQIAVFTSEQVSSLLQGGTVSIPEGEIALGDVVVVRQVQEGLVVEANADFTVALDTVVTPELDREGMARELLSRLQQCRKERDLRVTQRVKVSVFSEDADLKLALEEYGSWIASEVQADSLEIAEKAPVGADSGENEANGRKFCFTLTAI